ncbi:acetylxylan esterase [Asticcacaulis sp. EMRT-3]|uniref:glucuronyl esterase domain-containing protein n=1 Tax=Asticcacaulis sp. EMRT-3 TaxID=3040349 RepID=UPI0024AFF25A|nr:acetylxylan esterase [Asticcacaulis sp. EMRT-3]MDI7773960.1 acetylxylan esterase [Asticcacaulis sp. EMRT-3]
MKYLPAALLGLGMIALPAVAQAPVHFTAEQDHQNMMDQLGIKTLRPGPSGDPAAPDHANYDEAKANPYPDWPLPLVMADGTRVTTADQWWHTRRPQIAADFEREVVGRIPDNVPGVTWHEVATENEFYMAGGQFHQITATQLQGHVDNAAYPALSVNINAMLILPQTASAGDKVPVLIMFGPADFPVPTGPAGADLDRVNEALKADLVARDPGLAAIFAQHPGYRIAPATAFPPAPPEQRVQDLIADGWGVVLLDTASYQADNGAGLTEGIIGLTNHGQPRKPDQWGALRAWGWGASRVLDYLQTRPEVDAKHVGIEGVSRWGKAALITAAFDPRFYMVLVGSSGEGGAKPHRRNFGEAVESLTGSGEYHWMAGNFLKYGGPLTAKDLPVESDELIALCAPRLTFISYGNPAAGDASWLDQQGSYMATVAASPVWPLLGGKGLSGGGWPVAADYRTAKMPPIGTGMLEGDLAWRQHEGGHTDQPNMPYFIKWADAKMGRASKLP